MLLVILSGLLAGALAQAPCGQKPAQNPWRIVGGRDAEAGSWPWQLSLQYQRTDGTWGHTCGAVLIDPNWALTAAHCTNGRSIPENFRLALGEHKHSVADGTEQFVAIETIIEHERFAMNPLLGFPNDIGLLRLAEPANLESDAIGLACVPTPDMGDFAGHPDTWISGWGLTGFLEDTIPDTLQEAYIEVPTNAQCRQSIPQLRSFHICAGDGNPNACSGDSGGPMNTNVDGSWYVTGLTSFGNIFCALTPAVYTRVTSFYEWINTNMANYDASN